MGLDLHHVREIAERVAASYGLEIWDVELRGTGGKSRMLRVYIDRPAAGQQAGEPMAGQVGPAVGGVTHEDCANVSRELGTILDVEDAVPGGQYLLEVSSPGLDRKLWRPADFERFVGSRMKVMTREPIAGNRHHEGRLVSFGEGKLLLSLERTKDKGQSKKGKPAGGSRQAAGKAKHEGAPRQHDGEQREATGEGACATQVEIELSNVERANLVPEF